MSPNTTPIAASATATPARLCVGGLSFSKHRGHPDLQNLHRPSHARAPNPSAEAGRLRADRDTTALQHFRASVIGHGICIAHPGPERPRPIRAVTMQRLAARHPPHRAKTARCAFAPGICPQLGIALVLRFCGLMRCTSPFRRATWRRCSRPPGWPSRRCSSTAGIWPAILAGFDHHQHLRRLNAGAGPQPAAVCALRRRAHRSRRPRAPSWPGAGSVFRSPSTPRIPSSACSLPPRPELPGGRHHRRGRVWLGGLPRPRPPSAGGTGGRRRHRNPHRRAAHLRLHRHPRNEWALRRLPIAPAPGIALVLLVGLEIQVARGTTAPAIPASSATPATFASPSAPHPTTPVLQASERA